MMSSPIIPAIHWKQEEPTVTQHVPAAPQDVSANTSAISAASHRSSLLSYLTKTATIIWLEIRKIRHDPTDLITRAVQPTLWLLIFGEVFTRVRAIPTGNTSYLDFMAPGILAQSVLFIAIFSGIAIIWERDLGIVFKFLASPTPRTALVLGKALSAGIRALSQVVIIYLLSWLLGVALDFSPLPLLGVCVLALIGAACFSTFSLIIACLVKTRERFMGIGQILTMPLFFASNAIYPIAIMPAWLRIVARVNPLTYEVDALRALMLQNGVHGFNVGFDFIVLALATIVLVIVAGLVYPRVAT